MRLTLDLGTELPEDGLLNFCIYISPTPPQLLVLNGNHTLQQVNEKIWRVSGFLFFFNGHRNLYGIFLVGEQADGNVLHMEKVLRRQINCTPTFVNVLNELFLWIFF